MSAFFYNGVQYLEMDTVRITGVTTSPSGIHVKNMVGVIATTHDDAIKVWPLDKEIGNGKLWFSKESIRFLYLEEARS